MELFRWRYYGVHQNQHKLPDGRTIEHIHLSHPGAVTILPITNDGKLVLTYQYRPSVNQWLLEFPAGTLEAGEDPMLCAPRELTEEVNYQAEEWIDLGIFHPVPGFCDEIQYAYIAKHLSPCQGELDEDEVIEVVEFSIETFEEKIRCGEITDNKTIALYFRAKLQGHFDK